jgi:transcriptional regulator of acetoin/glycerol metabolism
VFLDEIGDISQYMQQALLRFLQEGEILPIGGKPKRVDVRIIAATNKDLVDLCHKGQFRWDLYYRLAGIEIELPSLIERGVVELNQYIGYFIKQKHKELRKRSLLKLGEQVKNVLMNYQYPGNLRELENIIAGLYVIQEDETTCSQLPKRMRNEQNSSMLMKDVEKAHIVRVLKYNSGNLQQSARSIGFALNTLKNKIKAYEIDVKDFKN